MIEHAPGMNMTTNYPGIYFYHPDTGATSLLLNFILQ